MTNKFNPVKYIGTGFEYSLRGTEGTGYTVTTNSSSHKRHYNTLKEAHDGIELSYRVFASK
jgi:hypothetical protein